MLVITYHIIICPPPEKYILHPPIQGFPSASLIPPTVPPCLVHRVGAKLADPRQRQRHGYNVAPPSYKLVNKSPSNYSYKYHKP